MQMFYVIVGSGKIDNHKVLKFCIKIETDKKCITRWGANDALYDGAKLLMIMLETGPIRGFLGTTGQIAISNNTIGLLVVLMNISLD